MNLTEAIRNDFPGTKIVILGDLVADQFLKGTISRVSREAPVFILRHDETATVPGAAANTAANVASLGGKACLIGVIGDDANGRALRAALVDSGVNVDGVIEVLGRSTPTKVRVLAGQNYAPRQQVIR
ncbi:MAG: D-glycero-beta-D-manno-heptose-7-phosphate kinase, partial [Acidobacteria bacterium]|nr:D-glycero-beta-D-manno-heptose-7-phosphate kinase [Acidobacteriota bacterium]